MDILPKESGFLCVDNKVWPKLEDDQRKFIQKYNANIRHSEDVGGLVAPDGVTIKQKARRSQNISNDESEDKPTVREEQSKSNNHQDEEAREPESKRQKV